MANLRFWIQYQKINFETVKGLKKVPQYRKNLAEKEKFLGLLQRPQRPLRKLLNTVRFFYILCEQPPENINEFVNS